MKFTAAVAALAGTSLAAPSVEKRATAINYVQNYNGNLANFKYNQQAGTFSASWNNPGDFVVGLGWTTGTTRSITFSGSYTTTASSYYAVYGWLNSPLTEYYVVENFSYDPCSNGGTVRGSVTSDGSSYKICTHTQNNQPSIVGTATFGQFFSVRASKRSAGTVTLANHFAAWKSQAGFQPGNYNYQVMAVEAFGGSGNAQVTVAEGSASAAPTSTAAASSSAPAQTSSPPKSSACTNTITTARPSTTAAQPTTTAAQPTTTANSGANCAAKWGQCGGQGWNGATCCQSGSSCKASNQYYSQCL